MIRFSLVMIAAAILTSPAAAHGPDEPVIKPARQCDRISSAQWRMVRAGMTLQAVEGIVGCRASHHSTNQFKSGAIDNYFFKTGGRNIAEIKIKNGKLWQKYGYHSGL